MSTINIFSDTGKFAENKDVARELREREIMPSLHKGERVIIDFKEVENATQSFIHALISDAIRKQGVEVLDKIDFKNCNPRVKAIIEIVVDYMQAVPDIHKNGHPK